MARQYIVPMSNVTIASTNTLVALSPVNPGPVLEIMRCWASQSGSATSAQQGVRIVEQVNSTAAISVVGSAATPQPVMNNDPASKISGGAICSTATATVNCTSEGTGTKSTYYPDAFNVLNGWLWVPTPNETHMMAPFGTSFSYGIFLPTSPGSTANWNAGISFRELG